MKSRKAQVTVEFLMIMMILLLALNTAAIVSYGKVKEISAAEMNLESERVISNAAGKINTVWLEGHGFETTLNLPSNILGYNYSVNISGNNILLYCKDNTYSKNILTRNITGNLELGQNTIRNEQGQVTII